MNLNKAIEIGIVMQKEQVYLLSPDGDDALLLLIEAGKRIQACREPEGGSPLPPLAGETID